MYVAIGEVGFADGYSRVGVIMNDGGAFFLEPRGSIISHPAFLNDPSGSSIVLDDRRPDRTMKKPVSSPRLADKALGLRVHFYGYRVDFLLLIPHASFYQLAYPARKEVDFYPIISTY